MADTESTCTSVEDRTEDLVSPTRDALVDGIVGLLKPCLDKLDDRVRATRVSQSELHQQLEGLAAELGRVQEQTRCPLQLDAYIKKLQNAKRRVVVVNNILQNTQGLLQNAKRRVVEVNNILQNTQGLFQNAKRRVLVVNNILQNTQNAKRRVVVVNNILQNTQDRLNKLHAQVNKENARRRALLETTSPSSTPSTSLHAP